MSNCFSMSQPFFFFFFEILETNWYLLLVQVNILKKKKIEKGEEKHVNKKLYINWKWISSQRKKWVVRGCQLSWCPWKKIDVGGSKERRQRSICVIKQKKKEKRKKTDNYHKRNCFGGLIYTKVYSSFIDCYMWPNINNFQPMYLLGLWPAPTSLPL